MKTKFAIYAGHIFYKKNKNWFSAIKISPDSWVKESFKFGLHRYKVFNTGTFSERLVEFYLNHNNKQFHRTLKTAVATLVKKKIISEIDVYEYRKLDAERFESRKTKKIAKCKAIEKAINDGFQTKNELISELKSLPIYRKKMKFGQFQVAGFYPKLTDLKKNPKFWIEVDRVSGFLRTYSSILSNTDAKNCIEGLILSAGF